MFHAGSGQGTHSQISYHCDACLILFSSSLYFIALMLILFTKHCIAAILPNVQCTYNEYTYRRKDTQASPIPRGISPNCSASHLGSLTPLHQWPDTKSSKLKAHLAWNPEWKGNKWVHVDGERLNMEYLPKTSTKRPVRMWDRKSVRELGVEWRAWGQGE